MHYHAEVWIGDNHSVDEQVTGMLAQFDDRLGVEWHEEWEEFVNPRGFWDSWQIGGTWKGVHVPGYDVEKDPENYEECNLCAGTGDRPGWVRHEGKQRVFVDPRAAEANGCNGCSGTGRTLKDAFPPHEKDIIPISDIPPDLGCYVLIVGNDIYPTEAWSGERLVKTGFDGKVAPKLAAIGITRGYLVTIDYRTEHLMGRQ